VRTPGARTPVEERRLPPGTLLDGGRYRVLRLLGAGSFGTTYVVSQPGLFDRPLVAKLLQRMQSAGAKRLFEREARVLTELRHPAIPQVVAYFEHDSQFCIVQEYIEGETLAARIQRERTIPERVVKHILLQLLDVLSYLHTRMPPVVHRDVKPDNIILGQDDILYLIDFGAVREVVDTGDGGGQTVIGPSGGFSPREVMLGRPEPASDIYMAGATALMMLTGRLPDRFFDPVTAVRIPLDVTNVPAEAGFVALISDLFNERIDLRPTAPVATERLRDAAPPPSRSGFIREAPVAGPGAHPTSEQPSAPTLLVGDTTPARRPSRRSLIATGAAAVLIVGVGAVWQSSRNAPPRNSRVPTDSVAPSARVDSAGVATGASTPTPPSPIARVRTAAGLMVSMSTPPTWILDVRVPAQSIGVRRANGGSRVWVGARSSANATLEGEQVLLPLTPSLRTDPGRPVIVTDARVLQSGWRFWKVRFLDAKGDTTAIRGAVAAKQLDNGASGWWFATFASEPDAAVALNAANSAMFSRP
jgi:serine/threonine protein kinase